MQLNNKTKIISDKDIIVTNGSNIGKSLSEVLDKQNDDISNLKSNVKYIYTHGGVGNGSSGGSGSGSSSSTWDVIVMLGGTDITDESSVIFTTPGQYKLFVKIMRANNGTYSIKYKTECGDAEDAMSEKANSFDNLYQFEATVNLSTNKQSISIVIEDDIGTMKVIKCRYIVNPLESDFRLFKNTNEESLDGGTLLLSSDGITSHSSSPYIEFWYSLGITVESITLTLNFGNYLNTSKIANSYTSDEDIEFFNPDSYEIASTDKSGKLTLKVKNITDEGTIKLYLNDILSAIGEGKGLSMLNPKNSAKYTINADFKATSSIGAMTSSMSVSFTAVPENVFMVVGDSSGTSHYFTESEVSDKNDNGDILASNKDLWTKKDSETTLYIYNALTVGESLTSNVRVYEGVLSSEKNYYRVTYTLTPSYNSFSDSNSTDNSDSDNYDSIMMNLEDFANAYRETDGHSDDETVIGSLYEWYKTQFRADHLNNFEKIIWKDGKEHKISYTYNYKEGDVDKIDAKSFSISKTVTVKTDNSVISQSTSVEEQGYKQISIPAIQTLGLCKVDWHVSGVKDTSKNYDLTYYIYVKPKPESVNWLLERMYGKTVTSFSGTSMKLSSHYYHLYPDETENHISNLRCNKSYNGFGTTVSKISTRTTDAESTTFTPLNPGYGTMRNYDTIISFSMRYSDLNDDDTEILKIKYNSGNYITFRKNYVFAEDNKICIPSDKIGDTTKHHLIQLVNHCIWSEDVVGEKNGAYITSIYIDGIVDNAYTSYGTAAMAVDSIELLKCDVDYDLIDIEYYKPLVITTTDEVDVLKKYDSENNTIETEKQQKSKSKDIIEMFMYNYWLRYNSSYNNVEFKGTYDQELSNVESVLNKIIFDGGHIKIANNDVLNTIAKYSKIPTLVLSLTYKNSNLNGYVMDNLQEEGTGSGDGAISKFGVYELSDVLWSPGNEHDLKSQLLVATDNDDFDSPIFYFKLQGSSTVNNRAKNLELGIKDRINNEKQQVLFSPNYNAEDSSTFLPEQKWTLKTDVADSAHANNTSIGKFVNAVTESPKRGDGKDNIKHLKNCLEGIPIMVYLRTNSGTQLQEINYLGMFNFNLGRKSEYNLGYNTADNTNAMIKSIRYNSTGFSYAFVDSIDHETGLVVAEISGNEGKFDFSQWKRDMLFDPKSADGSHYMYGDVVNDENIGVIVDMTKQVSLAGRFIFQKLGRHFNEGWNDSAPETDAYRTYDKNGNTYVNGFKHQYKWDGEKYVVETDTAGNELYDEDLGSNDSLYGLITDRKHEPNESDGEEEKDVVNAKGAMLDFTSLSEYYTIAIAFGMVDSALKNLNIKSWNGRTCYCQFYDMDCANGENNDGLEVIDYNIAMDYWKCNETADGYVDSIGIQFDYWPSSSSTENVSPGFDFPSHYLFAVAKYGRQMIEMIDDNTTGERNTQKYPQQFWAMLRCIPDSEEASKTDQKKYGKAHGELRSAEYFVDKYFNSGLGSMSKLFVNFNYDYKYFYRDNIVDGTTDTKSRIGKVTSFHGTRQYKVKEWLDNRFHFLDAMFQLDGTTLIAGQITNNSYETIDYYNKLVSGETEEVWSHNNFELPSYTPYLADTIPSYMTKDNTFFVGEDDILNNDDIYIKTSAFSKNGDDPSQLGSGMHVIDLKCKPNTLLTFINGETTTRYMLTKDATDIQHIKVELGGSKRFKAFGSKQFTWLDNIDAFLRTNTLVVSDNLTQIVATEAVQVKSFLINAPMCTKIVLNKSSYQGSLQFEQTTITNEDGVQTTTTALKNMELLKEIDISGSGLTCESDSNYFDGNNTCSLETLKINGVQSNNGVIVVTDMPKLTKIDISGTTIRPTILKTLNINCIRNNVVLNNTQISNIVLEVASDCKDKDIEFTINSDFAVENLTLVGFKKVTITTCQNLKSLIIRDNDEAQDEHKLSELTINNYATDATEKTLTSVTSISKDTRSTETNVFDLRHLVNLQKLEFGRCCSMVTLRLPGHVIDMTGSTSKFYENTGLKYIEGENGYGIYVNDNNTFSSFFHNSPITMFESGNDKILSSIYLGTSITKANNTWSWRQAYGMNLVKYILDNLFKDRYTFTAMAYDSNGKITATSKVTKVDDGIDYRSKMTDLNGCFNYKGGTKYTINQAETDYKTCNATDSSDINKGVKYKKRNLTTFDAEEFTVGNETDTDITDKNTKQTINGTNLVRPYMEAYVNLSGDCIFPYYPEGIFYDYADTKTLKANAGIYTKGFLSYGKNVKSLSGFPMYGGSRNNSSSITIYNFMLDSFENIGAKITTFKLNQETNYYPTARFWKYDTAKKELVQIDEASLISLSDFFSTLPNITTLSHFNLYSGQKFSFKNAFDKCTKLNYVSALCYYVSLSNISDIDELFKNCPITKCEKIFTEGNNIDDESASPFGTTSFGTSLSEKSNTANKTSYTGGRINIATFFNYETKNIQYLLNADTNKSKEVCMPIPRYVTYSDFVDIWDKLTNNSQKTLTRVDNLFANTVILMPNGSYTFNTNTPYNVTCISDKYSLVLGSDSSDDIPIFTNLTSARHLFDNFEMWYIKSYSEGNDASVALNGFTNNTIKTIGVNGNGDLNATNSELSDLKCKLPIYTKTRTFTPIKNGNAVIARDEKNAFLHKLRTVTDYAYAFRNFYFYKMLSYDFFSKRDKYDDAKASQDYYSYYEVPNQYSEDGTQKSSEAIYYKKDDSTGNLSVITDDSYEGARYQWGEATVLSYNYNGKVDGSNTANKINTLYRCFERTNFYYNSSDFTDSGKVMLNSQTFVPGDDETYANFNNPDEPDFDNRILANSYLGDRVLQASNFKITYEYDGVSKSDTFTSPYTRSKNAFPHKIYGNKSNITIKNDSTTTWINGLILDKGIPGESDSYDRLDSFYVKLGDATPYVITEKPNDTDGEVFKIYSNKKNYTLGTDLINKANTISNAYNVYVKDNTNNDTKYYYIKDTTKSTLSEQFEEKTSNNNEKAFKKSVDNKGIRYATYDWSTSTKLYEDISRVNAAGVTVTGSTSPIKLTVGDSVKGFKYYTYPEVVYSFVPITKFDDDLWYVDDDKVKVTNTYTNKGTSATYTWELSYNKNEQNYTGTISLDDVISDKTELTKNISESSKTSVLNDINDTSITPVFTSAEKADMTLESLADYLTRVSGSSTVSSIETSSPAATNRLTKQGNKNKHFCIDEINQKYSGEDCYNNFIKSKYNFSSTNSGVSNLQFRREWLCKKCGLNGYIPTASTSDVESVTIKTTESISDTASYGDKNSHKLTPTGCVDGSFANDYLQYIIASFKSVKYGSTLSTAANGVTYDSFNFTMPTVSVSQYWEEVTQYDGGKQMNTPTVVFTGESSVTDTHLNGGQAFYDIANKRIVFSQYGDLEDNFGNEKYEKISESYIYGTGTSRFVKTSGGFRQLVNFATSAKEVSYDTGSGCALYNDAGDDAVMNDNISIKIILSAYKISEHVGTTYTFTGDKAFNSSYVTCYGPKVSDNDYVFTESGNAFSRSEIVNDDLFKKVVIAHGTTLDSVSFRTASSTDALTHNDTKVEIPIRYRRDKYYYCTYVFEEYTYTKESSIEKDTSYMDNAKAHIQLVGTEKNNIDDNVIFGTPTYEKDDTGTNGTAIKKTGSVLYKVDCGVIYNYPTYSVNVEYEYGGEKISLPSKGEGGYYICPPDLFRGCSANGCDLSFVFSYTNAIGALHPDLLYNMKNVSISHWFRDVNILPQYIGHNTHVKQYTFIPSGFNLSGDLSYAFDFRYRLPKTYNPDSDNGTKGSFNNNSEYFILLKDSFALSGGYANVSSLKYAFSGRCYANRYKSVNGGTEWSNTGTVTYDYQPIRYISTETDYKLRGYNSHFYLCGSKGDNCYVPKGLPISLIGKTITLDNMISGGDGINNIASYFMGPVFDSSVHGEDITNSYFSSTSYTSVIYAPGSLLHPSVELPKYLVNPATSTNMDKSKYGRIICIWGSADDVRYKDSRTYVSVDTLGGSDSAKAYQECKVSWVDYNNYVYIMKYYANENDALAAGAYYNLVSEDNATESNLTPSSFYSDCHKD